MAKDLIDRESITKAEDITVSIKANEDTACQDVVWSVYCALKGLGYSDELVDRFIDPQGIDKCE